LKIIVGQAGRHAGEILQKEQIGVHVKHVGGRGWDIKNKQDSLSHRTGLWSKQRLADR
jgi:hypothetical protein